MKLLFADKINQKYQRILLGQLNSNGDCLYATTIAHQIKIDYPDCHLTWAIGSNCKSILDNNPHVDAIWEIPLDTIQQVTDTWKKFEREALARKKRGDFDEVFFTQVAPGNLQNYDGCIRAAIFRGYPYPISVSVSPVIRLSSQEIEKVKFFAEFHQLSKANHVILFESSPKSGQSFINQELALEIANIIVSKFDNVKIILSSNNSIQTNCDRIIDGSILSFRENAELTKFCSLLIGCSSGISWLATSDWAKPLPMVQLIDPDAFWFASFIRDYERWGLQTNHIIEMSCCSVEKVVECITTILIQDHQLAKQKFHEEISVTFKYYGRIQSSFLWRGNFKKALIFNINNLQQHGFKSQFFIAPFLELLRKPFLKYKNII